MAMPLDTTYQAPEGATLQDNGIWIMPNGDFAPGQEAVLQQFQQGGASAPQAAAMKEQETFFDPQKKLAYQVHGGKKFYLSPGGPTPEGGGGLVHGRLEWDPEKGEFVSHYDMGKIMSYVAAGILTAGAADAIMGGAAAGAGAAGSAGATEAGTGAAAAGTGAGVGVGETGATVGLASGAGLPGAVAAPVAGTAATGAGVAGASEFVGPINQVAAPGSTMSTIGSVLRKAAPLAGAIGQGVGAAASASGQNRLNQEQMGLAANGQNIAGQGAFESELMNRAKLEGDQRKEALKDAYRQSYASNRKAGPYNAAGITPMSPEYRKTLENVGGQANARLATPAAYDTSKMAPLAPYKPLDPKDVQGATGTKKGTLETVGDWLSPGLSTFDALRKLWS